MNRVKDHPHHTLYHPYKARRNQPLTPEQKASNRHLAQVLLSNHAAGRGCDPTIRCARLLGFACLMLVKAASLLSGLQGAYWASGWTKGRSSSRSWRRPRWMRDLAVPIGHEVIVAISSCESPSMSCRMTAVRNGSESR
jgi:hypothetical protein